MMPITAAPRSMLETRKKVRASLMRKPSPEFIAADSGLGFLINDARTFFLVSNMLLGAAVIGFIGVLANVLLRKLEGRLLRWRKESRGQA